MKIAAISACRHEAGADGKITEAFALLAAARVGHEHRLERSHDPRVIEIFGVELVHARAVKSRAEIEVVTSRSFADQTNLGEVGPRAAIGATCHANDDIVRGKPVRCELFVEGRQQSGK